MKHIKYKFLSAKIEEEDILLEVSMPYSEASEEVAKLEAYNGEYEIYDDGQVEIPTEAEKLDARLTYLEMMTGLLEV